MNREEIVESAIKFAQDSPLNYVSREAALNPRCSGIRLFDPPIFAFGSASDDFYTEFLSPDIIGGHFMPPMKWLPDAKTVISFFLPYTERIRLANATDFKWPADEWLHGRLEGQMLISGLSMHILEILAGAGYSGIAPSLDPRFKTGSERGKHTSNWSERHAAFACGLGTFGLSKGIITEKGTCGRFGSVLTEAVLPTDQRRYKAFDEYCIKCCACVPNCPANAISKEEGKDNTLCSDFLDRVLEKHAPRYGCGKCQIDVPCECGRP